MVEFGEIRKWCLGKDTGNVVFEPSLGRWEGSQQAAKCIPGRENSM